MIEDGKGTIDSPAENMLSKYEILSNSEIALDSSSCSISTFSKSISLLLAVQRATQFCFKL